MPKVKIQIKSYIGSILFEAEKEDYTTKRALQDAVLQGADLRGAVLQGADLQDAVLQGADLRGAVLQGADLQGADLRGADLQGADLRGADLQGADLRGADINQLGDYLNQCSRDMLFVFMHLKTELPFLREKLIKGEVNGTQYEGECACLIGTLGKADGGIEKVCKAIPFYRKGLDNYCEQWFYQIRVGDTPENSQFSAHALKLVDMVLNEDSDGKESN